MKYILTFLILLQGILFAIEPQVLVLFGGLGDLSKRKLVPALIQLEKKNLLPESFACICLGRQAVTREKFLEEVSHYLEDRELWQRFSEKFHYIQGEFEEVAGYHRLLNELKKFSGAPLFYLAVPPQNFSSILERLDNCHMLDDPNAKVIVEKPFGRDLDSARDLQNKITQFMRGDQVYLIDHYLGKHLILNLLTFRFSNPLIEGFWNKDQIESVSITISEELGIGSRGYFWEQTGLLRDLVQGHLMQVMSLIGMERPQSFSAEDIQEEKIRFIEAIQPISLDEIVRGQYEGYRKEKDVSADSSVETFVAAKMFVNTPRWEGVPFYLKAGKKLSKRIAEVVITFKSAKNKLVIEIQPKEEISLLINSLEPGLEASHVAHKLSWPLYELFSGSIPDAYERLLYEAMQGDRTHFVSYEEVMASWRLFTPILKYWEEHPADNFPNYTAGSEGVHFAL